MDFQQTYNALCAILQIFGNVLTKHTALFFPHVGKKDIDVNMTNPSFLLFTFFLNFLLSLVLLLPLLSANTSTSNTLFHALLVQKLQNSHKSLLF